MIKDKIVKLEKNKDFGFFNLKKYYGENIIIHYNPFYNEIARDDGILFNQNKDFIIILVNDKIKFISKRKIFRMEIIKK